MKLDDLTHSFDILLEDGSFLKMISEGFSSFLRGILCLIGAPLWIIGAFLIYPVRLLAPWNFDRQFPPFGNNYISFRTGEFGPVIRLGFFYYSRSERWHKDAISPKITYITGAEYRGKVGRWHVIFDKRDYGRYLKNRPRYQRQERLDAISFIISLFILYVGIKVSLWS